jgi:hypothetical protein
VGAVGVEAGYEQIGGKALAPDPEVPTLPPLQNRREELARQALDNLETVLGEAGFALADVVRLNYLDLRRVALDDALEVGARGQGPEGLAPVASQA